MICKHCSKRIIHAGDIYAHENGAKHCRPAWLYYPNFPPIAEPKEA